MQLSFVEGNSRKLYRDNEGKTLVRSLHKERECFKRKSNMQIKMTLVGLEEEETRMAEFSE